jgi:hypothetical protein
MRLKLSACVLRSLAVDPSTQLEPVLGVSFWNASVPLTRDERTEKPVAVVPPVLGNGPRKPRQPFEQSLTFLAQCALSICPPLLAEPSSDLNSILSVLLRYASVAFAVSEPLRRSEASIPPVTESVPTPSGDRRESGSPMRSERSRPAVTPVGGYPTTQREAVFDRRRRHIRVPLAVHELHESVETTLPIRVERRPDPPGYRFKGTDARRWDRPLSIPRALGEHPLAELHIALPMTNGRSAMPLALRERE